MSSQLLFTSLTDFSNSRLGRADYYELGEIKLVGAPGKIVRKVAGHFFGVRHINNATHHKPGDPVGVHSSREIVTRRD